MTAQVNDYIWFEGKKYAIVKISNPSLLEIDWETTYGIHPVFSSTACWTGYWCDFEAQKNGVFLTDAYIHCEQESDYVAIEGKMPEPIQYENAISLEKTEDGYVEKTVQIPAHMGHRHYKGLNKDMHYHGRLWIGKDFDDRYYIHMGYQEAFAYQTLLELSYDDTGVLTAIKDLSVQAAAQRNRLSAEEFQEQENVRFSKDGNRWVQERFSREE